LLRRVMAGGVGGVVLVEVQRIEWGKIAGAC